MTLKSLRERIARAAAWMQLAASQRSSSPHVYRNSGAKYVPCRRPWMVRNASGSYEIAVSTATRRDASRVERKPRQVHSRLTKRLSCALGTDAMRTPTVSSASDS